MEASKLWNLCQSICFRSIHFFKNHSSLITEEQVAMVHLHGNGEFPPDSQGPSSITIHTVLTAWWKAQWVSSATSW